ncbi:MAG: hypothetical protein H6713_15895 [Myxococcales bacterium]|nr:hypothetical protein [Myxococcales bacterium]
MCSICALLAASWTLAFARAAPERAREARPRVDSLLGRADHTSPWS